MTVKEVLEALKKESQRKQDATLGGGTLTSEEIVLGAGCIFLAFLESKGEVRELRRRLDVAAVALKCVLDALDRGVSPHRPDIEHAYELVTKEKQHGH